MWGSVDDRPILVLSHGDRTPLGWLGDVIVADGGAVRSVRLHRGQPIPASVDWRAVVSLGGPMGAYEDEHYPYLAVEKAFLRAAVAAGRPVLGICLGSQLLADALGGRAYPGPRMEFGFQPIRLTDGGASDPVVRGLDQPGLAWHRDTWDLPPGATLLAATDDYPQAFRLGSAVGLQFHAEVPPNVLEGWVRADQARLDAEGVPYEAVLAEARSFEPRSRVLAWRLFGAWLRDLPLARGRGGAAGSEAALG